MNDIYIFDRKLKHLQRSRAKNLLSKHDFLYQAAAEKLIDHLEGITKKFPALLNLSSYKNILPEKVKGRFGIKEILTEEFLGEDEVLPFEPESFDLILSLLNLHWVNDLPGCLIQLNHILKKDGLLVASIFGGSTLSELRQAIMEVEMKLAGGASPRISPFTDNRDAAGLLQRARFAMPVSDSEKITVMYKNVFSLIADLRGMGETNALIKRNKKYVGKNFFKLVDEKYHALFGDEKGEIPATFEIITISGTKN